MKQLFTTLFVIYFILGAFALIAWFLTPGINKTGMELWWMPMIPIGMSAIFYVARLICIVEKGSIKDSQRP